MSKLEELIAAHRRALSKFNIVINEQNRFEAEEQMTRKCEVDLLLAHQPGTGAVYGTSEDDLRKQVEEAYERHSICLYWLDRHKQDLYDEASDLLDHLRAKNLTFIRAAFAAWQIDRQRIEKKKASLEEQWREANDAEVQAAVALLRHPCADRKEERRRFEYIKQSGIMTGANDIYLTALWESFTDPQEGAVAYQVNVAAFEFMNGDGA